MLVRPEVQCKNVVAHGPRGFPWGFRSLFGRVSGGFRGFPPFCRHAGGCVFLKKTTHFATWGHRGKRLELTLIKILIGGMRHRRTVAGHPTPRRSRILAASRFAFRMDASRTRGAACARGAACVGGASMPLPLLYVTRLTVFARVQN